MSAQSFRVREVCDMSGVTIYSNNNWEHTVITGCPASLFQLETKENQCANPVSSSKNMSPSSIHTWGGKKKLGASRQKTRRSCRLLEIYADSFVLLDLKSSVQRFLFLVCVFCFLEG